MRFASVVTGVLVGSFACAQINPGREILFTETKAIALLPPQVVVNGLCQETYWSPDGKYLLVHSMETKGLAETLVQAIVSPGARPSQIPEQVVSIYDVAKQTSRVVWKGSQDKAVFGGAVWLPGGSAILSMRIPTKDAQAPPMGERVALWRVAVGSGQVSTLFQAAEHEDVEVITGKGAGGAILALRKFITTGLPEDFTARYIWITPNGTLGTAISAKGRSAYAQIMFLQKGARPMLVMRERSEGSAIKSTWLDMDFSNGTLRETAAPDLAADAEPEPEFHLVRGGTHTATANKELSLKSAWLVAKEKGPHDGALVAAEVESMSLSPAMNAVFYTTNGLGMVRPLASMPKELALKALMEAEKARVMSDAKQVGTAMHIYAADHDDQLPANGGDWMEALYPYTKNRQLLDGFVYTYDGGSLAGIDEPTKTQIGYKQGPGGRAVVYADGHVKWVPDR